MSDGPFGGRTKGEQAQAMGSGFNESLIDWDRLWPKLRDAVVDGVMFIPNLVNDWVNGPKDMEPTETGRRFMADNWDRTPLEGDEGKIAAVTPESWERDLAQWPDETVVETGPGYEAPSEIPQDGPGGRARIEGQAFGEHSSGENYEAPTAESYMENGVDTDDSTGMQYMSRAAQYFGQSSIRALMYTMYDRGELEYEDFMAAMDAMENGGMIPPDVVARIFLAERDD